MWKTQLQVRLAEIESRMVCPRHLEQIVTKHRDQVRATNRMDDDNLRRQVKDILDQQLLKILHNL